MRDRRDPLKWPSVLALAVVLTMGLFLGFPAAWLEGLYPDHSRPGQRADTPARRWLTLLPPPEIVIAPVRDPDRNPEPDQAQDNVPSRDLRWWSDGWQIKTGRAVSRDLALTSGDSIAILLEVLGVGQGILNTARPDSVLAIRLALMRWEDSFGFDAIKPYLNALTRAAAYADILSRAADMFDDFLQSEIMVPDRAGPDE